MWFVFGFITLISFSIYFGIQRRNARWKGSPASVESIDYTYFFETHKGTIRSFYVGIPAPKEYDFAFKRENNFDRLCKFLGLSVEHQVGAQEFDRLVYVVSNDQHLVEQLSPQQGLTGLVVELFQLKRFESQVKEVRCQGGRLWATFSVSRRFRDESDTKHLRKILPLAARSLERVVRQLALQPPRTPGTLRDPFILRAAVLVAISTGLVVNGVVHFGRLFWNTGEFTVDTSQLWMLSAYSAAALVGILVVAALAVLGRSARAHLVLIELILMGSIGAMLTVFTELRDLNMEMDRSAVAKIQSVVLNKNISRSRKSGTQYNVEVRDWVKPMDVRKIRVSSDFYAQVQVGQPLEFHQRSGFLGVRWVESFDLPSATR